MDIERKMPARTGITHGKFETLIKSFETKAADGSVRVEIEGYASTPDPDRGDDITLPSAFTATLETYMTNPVLLWDHGMDTMYGYRPIGQILTAAIDNGGLKVRAVVTDAHIAGMVSRGELRTMSFGYEVPEGGVEWVDDGNGRMLRVIKTLELYEISIVAMPMNPNARFSLAKSLKAYLARKDAKAVDGSAASPDATLDTAPADLSHPLTMPEQEAKAEAVVETPQAPIEIKEATSEPTAPVVEMKSVEEDSTAETPVVPAVESEDTTAPAEPELKAAEQTQDTLAVETKSAEPTEEKSQAVRLEPELKALEAKYAALEARTLAAETKAVELATKHADMDATLSLLVDQFIPIRNAVKATPVNAQPFAVVQQFADAKPKGLLSRIRDGQ